MEAGADEACSRKKGHGMNCSGRNHTISAKGGEGGQTDAPGEEKKEVGG